MIVAYKKSESSKLKRLRDIRAKLVAITKYCIHRHLLQSPIIESHSNGRDSAVCNCMGYIYEHIGYGLFHDIDIFVFSYAYITILIPA